MEELFLISIKTYLNKKNICETYFQLSRYYENRKNLKLLELKDLADDLRNYSIFIMFNINKSNFYLYSDFYKKIREKREKIKNIINNKLKSM